MEVTFVLLLMTMTLTLSFCQEDEDSDYPEVEEVILAHENCKDCDAYIKIDERLNLKLEMQKGQYKRVLKQAQKEEKQCVRDLEWCRKVQKEAQERVLPNYIKELKWAKGYFLGSASEPWYKATQECRKLGLELVSIESEEENTMIYNALLKEGESGTQMWISGSNLGQSIHSQFYWSATGADFPEEKKGDTLGYTAWQVGSPSSIGDRCVFLTSQWDQTAKANCLFWADGDCFNDNHAFLCKLR